MDTLWKDTEQELNEFPEVKNNQHLRGFLELISTHTFIDNKDTVSHVVDFYKKVVEQTTVRAINIQLKLFRERKKLKNKELKKGYDEFIDGLDDIMSRRKEYHHDIYYKYKYQDRNYTKKKK
jgi:TRAP-type mannitol/chloroaromatic compound transport system substrate-binding protein